MVAAATQALRVSASTTCTPVSTSRPARSSDAGPKPVGEPTGERGPGKATGGAGREQQPEAGPGQAQPVPGVEHPDGEGRHEGHVHHGEHEGQQPNAGVLPQPEHALGDIPAQPAAAARSGYPGAAESAEPAHQKSREPEQGGPRVDAGRASRTAGRGRLRRSAAGASRGRVLRAQTRTATTSMVVDTWSTSCRQERSPILAARGRRHGQTSRPTGRRRTPRPRCHPRRRRAGRRAACTDRTGSRSAARRGAPR